MKTEKQKIKPLSRAEMKQLTGGLIMVGWGKNCSELPCYLPYICNPWSVCASITGSTFP